MGTIPHGLDLPPTSPGSAPRLVNWWNGIVFPAGAVDVILPATRPWIRERDPFGGSRVTPAANRAVILIKRSSRDPRSRPGESP
jgi:hypothetical protein